MKQRVRGMRLTLAFSPRLSSSLGIGPVVELRAHRLWTVTCRDPEPSLRHH